MIKRLHALSEQLQNIKTDAAGLHTLLHRGPHAMKEGLLASNATNETIDLVSSAVDVLLDAVAELIVDAVAEVIVTRPPANT
jgi:hypothetical protein